VELVLGMVAAALGGGLVGATVALIWVRRRRNHRVERVLADLAHELKTPLTGLRGNLELLATHELPADLRRELIAAALDEEHEIETLVESMVDEEPLSYVDLAGLAREVAARFRTRTHRAVVVIVLGEPATVEARRREVERAVSNLVTNALKWGPPDRPVEVVVWGTSISVRDHGPGIPPEDLGRIFERSYRSPARSQVPGTGLGLAIVADVVRRHGGTTFARNLAEGGAEVGFTLPG
jgi:two-component system sensor histidine kinase MprB